MDERAIFISAIYSIIFSFCLIFSTLSVANEQALDVVIVLDTSGSMKKNDPKQLRAQAAKMFISLLERKDRVSLVGFSNRAYPVTKFLSLEKQKNEQILFNAIDQLASNGKYTNLHDAILRGHELLKKQSSKSRGQHIVLMSDGKMDLGSESRNLRQLEKTLEDLTPKLAKDKIKVHTIAFTDKSYIPLLKLTAEDTLGEFILMEDANSAHKVFENLFERAKLPEMLPIYEDNFVVDKAIKEITIIASKYKPDSVISLENPNGDEYSSLHPGKNIKWFRADKFDLITLKNPDPGYWLVKYTEGGNKVYLLSDLNLEVSSTKRTAAPGSPLHIQAFLSKNGKKQASKALLASTEFKVRAISPEGVEIENELLDDGTEIGSERHDGIYGISYAFDLEGTYKLEISALGQTFDRKKSLFVNVKSFEAKKPFEKMLDPPPPLPEATPLPMESNVEATQTEKQTDTSAQPNNDQKLTSATTEDPLPNNQTKTASAEDTLHETDNAKDAAAEHAADEQGEEFIEKPIDTETHGENGETDTETGEEGEAAEESSAFSLKNATIAFVLFNLILAIIGGVYYFLYRRKQKQKDKDLIEDDALDEKPQAAEAAETTDLSDTASESMSEIDSGAPSEISEDSDTLSSLSELDLEEELSSILESGDEK